MRAPELRKVKRVLISVSDKTGVIELARELVRQNVEILASGGTLKALEEQGIHARKVENFSGNPEAFQGRMKTLSFKIFSGILARRGDASDAHDRERLNIPEIDAVIVNFYPFEKADATASRAELTELIDIGGPALVRAAAKNSPDVLVLTDPAQYAEVIDDLRRWGGFTEATALRASARAWQRVLEYDQSIAAQFGERNRIALRYGENPHQNAYFEMDPDSPIRFDETLTPNSISYNNILDSSAAFRVLRDVCQFDPESVGVSIVKHNNPCGVALVKRSRPQALLEALELAWAGDPVSAFGGVLAFSDPLTPEVVQFLSERFIECVLAPGLVKDDSALTSILKKRKGLKALRIENLVPSQSPAVTTACPAPAGLLASHVLSVIGGKLHQQWDCLEKEQLRFVTGQEWTPAEQSLAHFGIAVTKNLKSNAIAIVGENAKGRLLLGAGQGQPNRIDALKILAVPRARDTATRTQSDWSRTVLVSDAFFPFADSVQACHEAGVKKVIQPGGSVRDAEVIEEAKKLGIELAFTGIRHFLH